ncbi:MAG: FISUMP domain-containing protein [Bacteroidota bacterium]|nr:hypothetical protein [Odoribacter sp.]MDP3644043.1 FISUMP domain-containing protein [Bacteroidota bacterium]
MKKLNLLLLILLAVVSIQAQDYQISFTGRGESTQVGTVKVENLTQGKSVTLNGTEILHLVATSTGIIPMLETENTLRIYPNPTNGNSTIDFVATAIGMANIELFDITGKKVGTAQNILTTNGNHSYQVCDLRSGIYTVRISSQSYNHIGKLVSKGTANSEVKINYLGNGIIQITSMKLKSANAEKIMQYTAGDRLKITGTSGNYTTVVTDTPTQNKTITFPFVDCTDGDGNNYQVVQIGTQIWMSTNLKTTKYRNGDPVPMVTDDTKWENLISGAYCNYSNDEITGNKYGKLYNWHAVNDSRNIAPIGWHIPTHNELTALESFVAGNLGPSGSVAKALASNTDWISSSVANSVGNDLTKNDTFGFTALPSGFRVKNGTFNYLGRYAGWWSSTEFDLTNDSVWNRSLNYEYSYMHKNVYYFKETGFSIRCLKD